MAKNSERLPHCIYPAPFDSFSQPVLLSLSLIIFLTLIRDTAIEYIQNASAMTNIPDNILDAILGDFVKLTDAP